ncbi:MAG: hypothetical protein EA398_16125 [Deltaproteobacteria bacterium]|nr:MAG: hypothetical protein EA398_16125 [Deltaproteobacteria bacterium]
MQTEEYLRALSPMDRAMVAQRWGLGTEVVPVMAELLRIPRVIQRTVRRLHEMGLYLLPSLLAQHAGHAMAVQPALEDEAKQFERWLLLRRSADGWSLPSDVAMALWKPTETERLFGRTLLLRAGPDAMATLERELGLAPVGSWIRRVGYVADEVARQATPPAECLAACAEAGSVPGEAIASVEVEPGSRGGVWRLTLQDGGALRVAPRELAERAGHVFPEQLVEGELRLQPEVAPRQVRLPDWGRSGALLRFSTAAAADEAVRQPALSRHVVRLLGDRVVLTDAECTWSRARALLEASGFEVEALQEPTGQVRHAGR